MVRLSRSAAGLLAATLLLLLPAAGCTEGDGGSAGASGASGVGTLLPGPRLDGAWHAVTTVGSDGCGGIVLRLADEVVLSIDQAGTDLSFGVFNRCGALVAGGAGTVRHSGATTLGYDRALVLSDSCTLELHKMQTGTYSRGDDRVAASGDCGPGFPCQITGTFLLERCPPGGCSFDDCDDAPAE